MDWPFKGVERMNVVGIIEIVRAVPYLALVVFWVKTPAHVLRVPVFFLLSTVLAAVLGLALFFRDYGSLQPQVEFDFWKRAMRESLPLGFGFLLLQVYYLTDTVVLGFLRGDTFVGWYSAAYRIVSFILVAGGLFFESTFPVISRYYQDARERLPRLLNSSLQVTALLVIPMAGQLSGIAGFDVTLWQGLFAPHATPSEVVARLNGAINRINPASHTVP